MGYPYSKTSFAEVELKAAIEGWKEPPTKCPYCQNGAVIFEEPQDMGDPDDKPCSCSWCDMEWNWVDPTGL